MKKSSALIKLHKFIIISLGIAFLASCRTCLLGNSKVELKTTTVEQISGLIENSNVLLFLSSAGVTQSKRCLSLVGDVTESEKKKLESLIFTSISDEWIYVSCQYYLQCGPYYFGIYIHPSDNLIGFDWTNYNALSTPATSVHNMFVCKDSDMVEWIKSFVSKSRNKNNGDEEGAKIIDTAELIH